MEWSIHDYCAKNSLEAATADAAALNFSQATTEFLALLGLPTRHPFCEKDDVEGFFSVLGVPPMGPLNHRFDDESPLEKLVTLWFMVAPPLLAMAELWLRLFAGLLGPLGCCVLLHTLLSPSEVVREKTVDQHKRARRLGLICSLTVSSSLVIMTDTPYVLNNGPIPGILLFLLSVLLALGVCFRYQLNLASVFVWILVTLAIHLVWDVTDTRSGTLKFGNPQELVTIPEGLYFNPSNALIQSLVNHWPETYRTYSIENRATPWMPSGDSRTGLPFLMNHWPAPNWHRVFLSTKHGLDDDEEYVALDIAFPTNGFQRSSPVFLILHGLNGGSNEEYIRDFTFRSINEGATVVVFIARGLMDLPIRGWNIFHGARVTDAHAAASAVRRALGKNQVLIGVGYSMGAIILSNYVASAGKDCALDGAISISGGLDMRFQEHFGRAQRLWQPMLAETLRTDFLLGKWGKRVHERLSKHEMLQMMRATHVTEIDKYAVVPYNGFRDLQHYYSSMSALGDMRIGELDVIDKVHGNGGKIHSVSVPLCVLHAFDDPLITWRATANNNGFMHPENLVKTGAGNILLLLTKSGGHVGWPTGIFPFQDKWKWMSEVTMTFGRAVALAQQMA